MATRRQIEQAARLFRHAVIAHMDLTPGPCQEVRQEAIDQAISAIHRLGLNPGDLLNEEDCLREIVVPNG